jgi:hypothetical protein
MAALFRRCLFSKNGLPRPPCPWDSRWKSVSVSLVLLFVAANIRGQDGKVPIEPGSPAVLYYLDDSAQLVPLEPQVVRVKRKFHGLGFTGTTAVYQVPGEKSTVRLKPDRKAEFIIRMKDKVDPLESVQFYRFEGLDGSRVVPIEDFDALGRATGFPLAPATVDFNAVKYGASSFKLIPIRKLAPGEYCLTVRLATKPERNSAGFCFGIDTVGS